jgi:nucleoid-associated protein YgaU
LIKFSKIVENISNNPLSAILSGIVIVVVTFSLYSFFFNNNKNAQDNGKITNKAAETKKGNGEELSKANSLPNEILNWVATDYTKGDISGKEYQVKEGDTLWEISEARYGSGFEWEKILKENSKSIGWLSNGNPLITPGQILVLPD